MANYTGVHCPVCNGRFTENDDIVVCPVCGAPHHRACYQQVGHCALNDLHMNGHAWQPPEADRQQPSGAAQGAVCPACGANNPQNGLFCQVCGAPLGRPAGARAAYGQGAPFGQHPEAGMNGPNAYAAAFGGLMPNEEIEGVTARDLALYIGANSRYFLPRFKQLSQHGGISFNFPALFFNFFYFFYRKMYAVGGILLAVFLLCQIPMLLIMPEYATFVYAHFDDLYRGIDVLSLYHPTQYLWAYNVIPLLHYFLLGLGLLFAVLANRLYLNHTLGQVRKIRGQFTVEDATFDDQGYTESLARNGRTNRAVIVLLIMGAVVAYLMVVYFIVAPAII